MLVRQIFKFNNKLISYFHILRYINTILVIYSLTTSEPHSKNMRFAFLISYEMLQSIR